MPHHATIRLLALLSFVAVLLSGGCRRDEGQVGTPTAPVVVVLSESHGADDASVRELQQLLSEASGLAVELRVAPSSEAAVRMAGSPNTDAALLSVFEYLFCRQLYGVRAGLRVVRVGGGKSHHGEIVARAAEPVTKLEDLRGKKVAFVDRYSSTGYLLATKLFADAGVSVDPMFMGTHAAALAALKAGRAEAAATYEDAVTGDESLRVLSKTPAIPNEPLFFRKDLDPEKRQKLMDAFRSVATRPEGKKTLANIAHTEGFEPVTDGEYSATKALINSIGKSVKDVVPRGWVLSNEEERGPGDLAP